MQVAVPRSLPPARAHRARRRRTTQRPQRPQNQNDLSVSSASSALYVVKPSWAWLLHMAPASRHARRGKAETLTVDETSFPNAKPRDALLIAYKAFADLAGKASLFVIVIVAARRLTPESFGVFSLGSTLGWLVAV